MYTSLAFFSALCAFSSASELHKRQTTTSSPSIPTNVPSFAYEYAPMVWLFSEETYLPGDIMSQLTNTEPEINSSMAIADAPSPLTLDNLADLNTVPDADDGANVYLTSVPAATTFPAWFNGVKPNSDGETVGAVSCAIILNTHADNASIVDVYYMYFYNFNYGGEYYGLIVDDHVGDWEHNMIRFIDEQPYAMYFSQHSYGEAIEYAALSKYNGGVRPVDYSANGTHANYATSGAHDHTIPYVDLPFGPIEDHTDAGTLWDPTLSAYYYTYDNTTNTFAAFDDATSPVDWLSFTGRWGDEELAESNPAQSCPLDISALCKWTSGPTGPEDKDLARTTMCPSGDLCDVLTIVLPGEK